MIVLRLGPEIDSMRTKENKEYMRCAHRHLSRVAAGGLLFGRSRGSHWKRTRDPRVMDAQRAAGFKITQPFSEPQLYVTRFIAS